MIKDIPLSGLSSEPSDYECADGQLAESLNFISENTHLCPIADPLVIGSLPQGAAKVFRHRVGHHDCFLFEQGGEAFAIIKPSDQFPSDGDEPVSLGHFSGISHFNALGNTLMIVHSAGIEFFLWKEDSYLHLGNHLPELSLSFGLVADIAESATFDVELESDIISQYKDTSSTSDIPLPAGSASRRSATNTILAQVNKFIAERSTNAGRFMFPFFVRYAFRLYDDTLTMHSAPVLMYPSTLAPYLHIEGNVDHNTIKDCRLFALVCRLFTTLNHTQSFRDIAERWRDIIKSVDIFISAPIYTYRQSGEVEVLSRGVPGFQGAYNTLSINKDDAFGFSISRLQGDFDGNLPNHHIIARRNISDLYLAAKGNQGTQFVENTFALPRYTSDEIIANVRDNANFYLIKSLSIDDLLASVSGEGSDMQVSDIPIDIPVDFLQSLTARERMTDDFDSHDTLIPTSSYIYNRRLNLAGLKKQLFEGYNPNSLFTQCKGHTIATNGSVSSDTKSFRVFVFIKRGGRDIVVDAGAHEGIADFTAGYNPFMFFYYPDRMAYKALICPLNNNTGRPTMTGAFVLPLVPHDFLNGAFFFDGFKSPASLTYGTLPSVSPSSTIDVPGKLYTSAVDNPFHFPVTGITTIGSGEILAISSATKPLSQGQFGAFPLYAFTSEGVWALRVSDDGTFSSVQPVTLDTPLDRRTPICQLDQAVAFASPRGIMLLEGSTSTCISDYISALLNPLLPDIKIIYDYSAQRLVVFSTQYDNDSPALIYSLKSKRWGAASYSLADVVNAYPHCIAIDHSSRLVDLDKGDTIPAGRITTRPIKFSEPDILKSVSALFVRGLFESGHISGAIFGSRDCIHWHKVWASSSHRFSGFRGSPYKFFRIELHTSLQPGESIFSLSFDINPRFLNRLR